jgi:hypothetical protein
MPQAEKDLKVAGLDAGKHVLACVSNCTSIRFPPNPPPGRKRSNRKKQQRAEGRHTINYTAKQRRHESGAKVHESYLPEAPQVVSDQEKLLQPHNSRAFELEDFKNYMAAYCKAWPVCRGFYLLPKRRVVKWLNWKGRRRSEDQFANHVVDTFGKDVIIAYGATTGFHALKGLAPTPTTAIHRCLERKQRSLFLAEQAKAAADGGRAPMPTMEIITTPEARTTINCPECHQPTMKEDPSRTRLTPSGKKGACAVFFFF